MRTMSYKITMRDFDKYEISSARDSWDYISKKERENTPAVRIKSEPFPEGYARCGQVIDLDDYIEPHFLRSDVPKLYDNYLKAIHGDLKGWKLIAIKVRRMHIELIVGNGKGNYNHFKITAAPHLYFSVEAPTFGGKTDRFIIEASIKDADSKDKVFRKPFDRIVITEPCETGWRKIVFTNMEDTGLPYVQDEWIDITVVECR